MMKKIKQLIITVAMFILAMPVVILAESLPMPSMPPIIVSGTVTIDGNIASSGTVSVEGGQIITPITANISDAGKYSVQVPYENGGETLTFKVNNKDAASRIVIGPTKKINLSITTEPTPPPASGGTGGGTPSVPSSVSSSDKPVTVSSGQKGSLSQNLGDGNSVDVEIPKNSVGSKTTFTAKKGSMTSGNTPSDSMGAFLVSGLVFNVNAKDSNGDQVRNFSENLTITLTASDLPTDTSGLGVYYFNEAASEWELVPGAVFSGNEITFQVNHLTLFAVFQVVNNEDDQETPKIPVVKGVLDVAVIDGDIIQCKTSSNPFAVYIVKSVGDTKYIRHIVSLEIFDYYGHLKWENLKQVGSLDEYSLSGWVRHNTGPNGTAGPTDKVYEINGDQTKHWINMTAEDFLAHGGSEPAIYSVNQGELDLYVTGADVMSL